MYEIFEKLLNARGITIYKFCKETGVSESTIYTWRKKVTADYLMTGKEKDADSKYYLNDETAAIAQNIFENRELRLLFDAAKDAEPEDLETVHSMLLALKRKERGNID